LINTLTDGIELKGRETLCALIVASLTALTLYNISFALANARNCNNFVNWMIFSYPGGSRMDSLLRRKLGGTDTSLTSNTTAPSPTNVG
jgi:hypothetical protein